MRVCHFDNTYDLKQLCSFR